ncbi:hypothetical protein OROGR_015372 [Orobanche gracilis]
MGLADNTKKGVENLPVKRREPVELREITVERRLDALETRVEILLEQFEEIKQVQAQLREMMGRFEQWHISQGHYPPPPPY